MYEESQASTPYFTGGASAFSRGTTLGLGDKVGGLMNDFGTNMAVNGIANSAGMVIDKIPYTRGGSIVGRKFIRQGINSLADKLKKMFYTADEK